MIIIYILGYVFIGIIIQLVCKGILALLKSDGKFGYMMINYAIDGDSATGITDEEAVKLTWDIPLTLLNVVIWPVNIIFAIYVVIMMCIRLSRED